MAKLSKAQASARSKAGWKTRRNKLGNAVSKHGPGRTFKGTTLAQKTANRKASNKAARKAWVVRTGVSVAATGASLGGAHLQQKGKAGGAALAAAGTVGSLGALHYAARKKADRRLAYTQTTNNSVGHARGIAGGLNPYNYGAAKRNAKTGIRGSAHNTVGTKAGSRVGRKRY